MALGAKALTAIVLALVILSLTMLPTWSMAFLILLGMIASAFDRAKEVTTTIPIIPQDPAPTADASGDAQGDAPDDASAQSSAVGAHGIEMPRRRRGTSECEVEEERCGDVSTELVPGYDPYKIKKKLKKSDLSHHLSRLLISQAGVATYVLPCMDEEIARRAKSGEGAEVVVWDADTRSEHRLVFASWGSGSYYALRGGWSKEFVQRRGLAEGDEIGIHWDPNTSKFNFSLLHKAKRLGELASHETRLLIN